MRKILLLLLLALMIGCGQKAPHYGSYSIGRDTSWIPLDFGQFRPNLNGFTNALVQKIAEIEDIPLKMIDIGWTQLFQELDDGNVGGIFTSIPPNTLTLNKYTFSDPFLMLGPVLIVPYDSKAKSLEDLAGSIIAVNQFDNSVLIAQRVPSLIIRLYQNMPSALEDLASGKIDAVLMPILDARALVPSVYSFKLKIVTPPLNDKALRLITLKGHNKKLIRHFNKGLLQLMQTGNYEELRNQFNLK